MRIPIGDRVLDCTHHTAIMGIVNVGTDSPVAESVVAADAALDFARRQVEEGAALVDIGAHSTRSGGESPSAQEEIDRLCPVVAALARDGILRFGGHVAGRSRARGRRGRRARPQRRVRGQRPGDRRRRRAGQRPAHRHAHARAAQTAPRRRPALRRRGDARFADFLAARAAELAAQGVRQIWLDPGYEFAKSAEDNVRMLIDTPQLLQLGRPVLVSASRKGFLAELLGHPKLPSADVQSVDGLSEATLAFNTLAAQLGVHIVRVHDVRATARALRVVDAVRRLE